jgi:hypothetical protein
MFLNCFECQETLGMPNPSTAEYNDSGVFHLTCSRGHQSVTVLQQNRSELLFEIACNAINDGYYREAVSSFAASLERFYEYAIRVILNNTDTSQEVFKSCWKEVSNQSERQLGAFIFLWAAFLGEKPGILTSDWTSFRNKVVHKGSIPNKDEAIAFGEAVYELISPLRARLSREMADACQRVLFEMLHELRPKGHQGPVATASMNFFLRDSAGGAPSNLRDHLDALAKQAVMMKMFDTMLMNIAPQTRVPI